MEKLDSIDDGKLKGDSLLVIGNGFDLQCDLHSSYKEYFDYRIKTDSPMVALYDFYKKYDTFISKECRKKYFILKEYRNEYDEFYKKNFPTNLDASISVWDLYFLKQYSENPDWFEIEHELLKSFNYYQTDFDFTRIFDDETKKDFISLEYNYGDNPLIRFLMTRYTKLNDLKFKKEDWSKYLLTELNLFEKKFGDYIKEQSSENYRKNANELFSKIKSKTEDIGYIKWIESFNYSEPKLGLQIRHINGDFRSPIFGIDSACLDSDCLFSFTKTSRRMKLQFSGNYDSNRGKFKNLIIYGHSLNVPDYNYFFPIFDYLKISDAVETSKIIFCYSIYKRKNETDEEARDRISIETEERIKKIIFAYGEHLNLDSKHKFRLLDAITSTGRMKIVEIQPLEEITTVESQQSINLQNNDSSQQARP